MRFLCKVSFAGFDVTGQAGQVVDLPADSEYAIKFCEPLEPIKPAPEPPAPRPKSKRAAT